MLFAAFFTIAKTRTQPAHREVDSGMVVHMYKRVLFSQYEEGNPTTCNNTDTPTGRHTKGNKSDRERQMLDEFTYMWNLRKKRTCKIESRLVPELGVGGMEMGEGGQKEYTSRSIGPGDIVDSMVTSY